MKLCILASGSAGNSIFVSSGTSRILVDAGLSCKETAKRLQAIGESLEQVNAICVTHEHSDHTAGLDVISRRLQVPLYANSGTAEAVERNGRIGPLPWNVFSTGQAFAVGDLRLEPFSVAHDSYDPVGFVIGDSRSPPSRVGIVTDIGMATELVRQRLRNCTVLIVESNHDEDLLRNSDRPWALKQRISGRQGHFSNRQAGELVAAVAGPELRHVFLCHLSSECNKPALALRDMRTTLDRLARNGVGVQVATPGIGPVVEW